MDPSYQPFIDSTYFERIFVSASTLRLPTEPAIDLVTPGIGMVANLYSCYEPIFYRNAQSELKKTIETEEEQIGQGESDKLR